MAQYSKNFYGSTYYGDTNAFSGEYVTKPIPTDENLKGTFDVNINASMPDANYGPVDNEVKQVAGVWSYDAALGYIMTNSPSAELQFRATCDRVLIKYHQRSNAPIKVNVHITTNESGKAPVVTTYSFNPNSTTINTNAQFVIDNLPYGMQTVRIYLESNNPATSYFRFTGVEARVTHFTVETRASLNETNWTPWVKIPLTKTVITGVDRYLVEGTTSSYAGKNVIQVKVFMATSDNGKTPVLEDLETIAGNSENRTEDGRWEAIINMANVASASTATYLEVTEIDWATTAPVPETTELFIRTQSSDDLVVGEGIAWGAVTVPYMKNVNRLRLKEGFTEGYMDVPYVQPGSTNTHTLRWDSWDDQSFLPPDRSSVSVSYVFMDSTKNESNPVHRILNPMNTTSRGLATTRLNKMDFLLRVRLKRRMDKSSPAVDWIDLTSWMEYSESKVFTEYDSSPIDSDNTGEKKLLEMNTLMYSPPIEVTAPTYHLIDNTGRPNDASVFYYSERNALSRTNIALGKTGSIWAKATAREINGKTGIRKHYQYGGGTVKYPETDEIEMASIFTPSLDPVSKGTKYRYFLLKGWPNVKHTIVQGDTLESIAIQYDTTVDAIESVPGFGPVYDNKGNLVVGGNNSITIPNNTNNADVSIQWATGSSVTDKSSHNALVENRTSGEAPISLESDSIQATVSNESIYGLVEWVSGEKIYDGVVNPNDIRYEYKRTHSTPSSGDSIKINYVAITNDTFASISKKFGVYEADVRAENGATKDEEPAPGTQLLIPSRIVLPLIDPKAIIEENPYELTIVYNSVKKKDGTILPESVILPKPMQITYKEETVTGEEIIRGPIPNGRDLLPDPRVVRILDIKNASGMPYNQVTVVNGVPSSGDFTLDDNHVNWGQTDGFASEPIVGNKYYVSYVHLVPDKVTVTIDTNYKEEGGIDRVWRSPEVKEFTGMCYPGKDHRMELPAFTSWMGSAEQGIEDFEYLIEDNDLWVKTWIEEKDNKYYSVGSLQDRVPKDNWFPTIQTGYYYLGKQEFYLYNEPIIVEPQDREMPIAKNVSYGVGKHASAVYLQQGSSNLIRNSGFDVASSKQTVYKLTFGNVGVAGLGATN